MSAFAALAAGGGLLSFAGRYRSAETTEALGDLNFDLAHRRERSIRRSGRDAAEQSNLRVGHLIETQRVGLATAGVSVETGAALEIQAEAARIGSERASEIRYNAALAAWGVRSQAELDKFASDESAKAQKLGAFAGLIGTGSALAQ